jgi:transcriptional regulator with XRE-family HTH domain
MATDKLFFKTLMAQHGLSLRTVASMMGLGHSQLSLTLSDKRRMQLDEAALLAQIFGVPLARVAEAAGIAIGRDARIPLVGCMLGNGEVLVFKKKEYSPAPDGLPEDVVVIQARTADSANAWLDGWNFYCQPPVDVAGDALGRFCYAQVVDGPIVLATVRRGYQSGTFNLSGPYAAESVYLEWATPVLMARS